MTLRKPAPTASPVVGSVEVTGSTAGGMSWNGTEMGCRSLRDGSTIRGPGGGGGGGGTGVAGAGVPGVACAISGWSVGCCGDCCGGSAGCDWAHATSGSAGPENRTAAATTAEIHEEVFMALPPSLVMRHSLLGTPRPRWNRSRGWQGNRRGRNHPLPKIGAPPGLYQGKTG